MPKIKKGRQHGVGTADAAGSGGTKAGNKQKSYKIELGMLLVF